MTTETTNIDKTEVTTRLNPIVRTILQGVYDENSPLSQLLGVPHVLQIIWKKVTLYWKKHIEVAQRETFLVKEEPPVKVGNLAFQAYNYDLIKFPKPTDININMMPFVMADPVEDYLPKFLEPYYDLIKFILEIVYFEDKSQSDQIGYLTIQESYVDKSMSQRRPGIHTETPGVVYINGSDEDHVIENGSEKIILSKGSGSTRLGSLPVWWGKGGYRSEYGFQGGIYMASSVEDSCELWNCRILKDNSGDEIIGKLGDIEHLREFLPPDSELVKSNCIYWLTDRTPHESLPLKKGTYRQFIRLVTREVSIWYEDHSTKNPLGTVPDPAITKVVTGSKFDERGVVLK